MFLRMISRCTRSADFTAASWRNFCAAVSAEELSPTCVEWVDEVLIAFLFAYQLPGSSPCLRVRGPRRARSWLVGVVVSVVRFALALVRQNTCQMNSFGAVFAPAQDSLHVHQATGINGRNVLRSGHRHAVALRFAHRHRDAFEFCGKRSAKAA